tara:strand:- start:76 stop:264 length:189 start_codon:yes stop_codon:yes gene_type:complete
LSQHILGPFETFCKEIGLNFGMYGSAGGAGVAGVAGGVTGVAGVGGGVGGFGRDLANRQFIL